MTNNFVFVCLLLFLFLMCDIRKDDLKLEWTKYGFHNYFYYMRQLSSCVSITPLLTLIIFVEEALGHRKDEAILTLYHW